MAEVMPQIALRIPARQLRRIDSIVRRAAEKARANGEPDSFSNRSSILRMILDRGADVVETSLKDATPCNPTKERSNAVSAKRR